MTNKISILSALVGIYLLSSQSAMGEVSQNSDSATYAYHSVKFERVVDGDTFIASGRRIRIWGIDAPEHDEPLVKLSSMFLESLISEKSLRCKFINVDQYERYVMQCSIDGTDVGSAMVRWGMAKNYMKFSDGFYSDDEKIAKSMQRGDMALAQRIMDD